MNQTMRDVYEAEIASLKAELAEATRRGDNWKASWQHERAHNRRLVDLLNLIWSRHGCCCEICQEVDKECREIMHKQAVEMAKELGE